MNYLWGFMILIGVVYGAISGNLPNVTQAAINSAKEAVTLAITMTGVMAFWMGIMKIAENSGIMQSAVRGMRPVLKFLFPRIPKEHPANHYIAVNMIANVLGLGWAATPAGLKAMQELSHLQEERGQPKHIASREMCIFLIINISSLQLIPVSIVAYRSQYGSVNPAAVIGPGLAATCISTLAAVIFCKVMDWKRRA
ncbi:MAG: nucleoside recognition protein [Lachnospiraceae bacterium]|nr:nucleoside recognition protein [Lachnospiraceae bacterium]MDE7434922.1 nucleoside recognition protein [Lachnospiraceae bacterium]